MAMTLQELEAAVNALTVEVNQVKTEMQRQRRVIRNLRDELQARNPRAHEKIDWEDS